MDVPFREVANRRLAGGWKCTPFGASSSTVVGSRRHVRGATPYARVKARLNASCER